MSFSFCCYANLSHLTFFSHFRQEFLHLLFHSLRMRCLFFKRRQLIWMWVKSSWWYNEINRKFLDKLETEHNLYGLHDEEHSSDANAWLDVSKLASSSNLDEAFLAHFLAHAIYIHSLISCLLSYFYWESTYHCTSLCSRYFWLYLGHKYLACFSLGIVQTDM